MQGEFYSWAAFGYGLNATLLGRPVSADGGMKATLTPATQAYATEVAQDEINHVRAGASHPGLHHITLPGKTQLIAACSQALLLSAMTAQRLSRHYETLHDRPSWRSCAMHWGVLCCGAWKEEERNDCICVSQVGLTQ